MYTNYRCIPFPPNDNHVSKLSFGIFHPTLFTIHLSLVIKEKNAEMSFLRVNDLLLVCIVQNHDADSPLYIIKNMFSLKINKKLPLEKCVYLWWKVLAAWFPT